MNWRKSVFILWTGCLLLDVAIAAGTLSERHYKQLQSIHKLIEKQQLSNAKKQLDQFLSARHDGYTQALFLQTAAHVAIEQGQYDQAIDYLKKAHNINALPDFVNRNIEYNLAQLYAQENDWNKSLEVLKQWLSGNKKITPEQHIFAATVYGRKRQYQSAIKHVKQAIKNSSKTEESWYQMLISFYLEQKKYQQAIPVYLTLIKLYPDKNNYWKQLSELYLQTQNPHKALAVLQLAEQQGILSTEQEILRLANLYLYANIPVQAAQLIQEKMNTGGIPADIKNRNKLADSWIQAQEYSQAIKVLNQLSQLDQNNGLYQFRIGRLYMEQGNWSQALKAFERAQSKKQLDQGHNALLLGICAYYDKKPAKAKIAFENAQKFNKYREQASDWLEALE